MSLSPLLCCILSDCQRVFGVCVYVCVPVPCPTAALEAVRVGLAGVCLERARRVSALWWQYHMTQALCHHMPLMQWWSEAWPGPLWAPQSRFLESERVFTAKKWQTEQVGRKNKWMGFWLAVKTSAWGTFVEEVHWSVQSNFKQLSGHQSWFFFLFLFLGIDKFYWRKLHKLLLVPLSNRAPSYTVCRIVQLCKTHKNYT